MKTLKSSLNIQKNKIKHVIFSFQVADVRIMLGRTNYEKVSDNGWVTNN